MKKLALSVLAAVMLAAALVIPAFAVTANPEPITVDNGKGEPVTIQLVGDEFYYYRTDQSGNVIERDDEGVLRYVVADEYENYAFGEVVTDDSVSVFTLARLFTDKVSASALDRDKLTKLRGATYGGEDEVSLFEATERTDPIQSNTVGYDENDIQAPERGSTIPLLVIMVDFTDCTCQFTDTEWSSFVFGENGNGGVEAYYKEVSNSTFYYTPATESSGTANDGVVRITLPINHPLWDSVNDVINPGKYNGKDGNEYNIDNDSTLIAYAWNAANEYVNFASYDKEVDGKKDGYISPTELAFMFVIAGYEASSYGPDNNDPAVWAHSWQYVNKYYNGLSLQLDGVKLYKYTRMGELYLDYSYDKNGNKIVTKYDYKNPDKSKATHMTIGCVCHELGHDLGVMDLYDTKYSKLPLNVNRLSLMAAGSWGFEDGKTPGSSPSHFDAWTKLQLGFYTGHVTEATPETVNYALTQSATSSAYNIIKVNTSEPGVYYLIENRQYAGFDAALKNWYDRAATEYSAARDNTAGGIVVWRIDQNAIDKRIGLNAINNQEDYGVMPVYLDIDGKPSQYYPFRNTLTSTVNKGADLILQETPEVKLSGFTAASDAVAVNIVTAAKTATPTCTNNMVAKGSVSLTSASYDLTNAVTDYITNSTTFKVYTSQTGSEQWSGVTVSAALDNATTPTKWVVTLTTETDLAPGSYWLTAQNESQSESDRLRLKVDPFGVTTAYKVDVNELDFGYKYVGYETSPKKTITITNMGTTEITGISFGSSFYKEYSARIYETMSLKNYGDTAAFYISPDTGLAVGKHDLTATVQVSYANPDKISPPPTDSFNLSLKFTVMAYPLIDTGDTSGGSDKKPDKTGAATGAGTVDGKSVSIGTVTAVDGVNTLTVDTSAVKNALTGSSTSVSMALTGDSGQFVLTAELINAITASGAELNLTVGDCGLTLPDGAIDTAGLASTLGAKPADIKITAYVGPYSGSVTAPAGARVVGTPVEFTATASSGANSVEITGFNTFVERALPIPSGSAVTTGAVFRNGTLAPVPTVIGGDRAYLHSLTNSVYVLVSGGASFSDAADTWYADVARDMSSRLIMKGDEYGRFNGELDITRAEFAQVLVTALGLPSGGASSFADVDGSAWYSGAVAAAEKYGVVSGDGTGYFYPTAKISRQEAIVMLYRASALCDMQEEIPQQTGSITGPLEGFALYEDSGDVSDWAQEAVHWSITQGIIKGSNYLIRPAANISRAETAAMTLRFLSAAGLTN